MPLPLLSPPLLLTHSPLKLDTPLAFPPSSSSSSMDAEERKGGTQGEWEACHEPRKDKGGTLLLLPLPSAAPRTMRGIKHAPALRAEIMLLPAAAMASCARARGGKRGGGVASPPPGSTLPPPTSTVDDANASAGLNTTRCAVVSNTWMLVRWKTRCTPLASVPVTTHPPCCCCCCCSARRRGGGVWPSSRHVARGGAGLAVALPACHTPCSLHKARPARAARRKRVLPTSAQDVGDGWGGVVPSPPRGVPGAACAAYSGVPAAARDACSGVPGAA